MGEDGSSFRTVPTKIPTNEARIRWGIGRPSRKPGVNEPPAPAVETPLNLSLMDTEILSVIEETGLSSAPVLVYGKCNEAVRWDEKPWNPGEETLARLAAYSGNLDIMYSDKGPFRSIPFQLITGRNISNPPARFEDPFYQFSVSPGGQLWQMSIKGFQKGITDLCVFETQVNNQTGVCIAIKPDTPVAQERGDLKLFFHFDLSNSAAEKLFNFVQAHPDSPYKLIQALFPNAFIPAVSKDRIQTAWRNKGAAVLGRDGTKYINYHTGLHVKEEQEDITPEEAFTRLKAYEEIMMNNVGDAICLDRYAPQTELVLVDMRDKSVYTYSMYRGGDSTVGEATRILPLSIDNS